MSARCRRPNRWIDHDQARRHYTLDGDDDEGCYPKTEGTCPGTQRAFPYPSSMRTAK
jgi:hypothetical protein